MSVSTKVDAIRVAAAAARRGERCSHCFKPAPGRDSDEFADWAAADSSGVSVVCRDCLKVRENRLRRAAGRQRCRLVKSRRRDPNAWDYGTYSLIDNGANGVLLQNADLDAVEEWLGGPLVTL